MFRFLMGHFDPTVTLGNLLTIISLLVAGLWYVSKADARIKALEDWRARHEHSIVEVVSNITTLREMAAKMTALAEGQERRLVLLEDRASFESRRHN